MSLYRSMSLVPVRHFTTSSRSAAVRSFSGAIRANREASTGGGGGPLSFFGRPRLPTNKGIMFVPQQEAWVVERMGKYLATLEPGLRILIPILDKVRYVQSLKEVAMEIPSQSAITADNVTLDIDGVLYIRVFDAYKASYGVEDAEYAVSQLAQTTMRSEIGQLTLDHVLKERQNLNANITEAINDAAQDWGVKCLRYEIRDIHPPDNVLHAMHRQVSAERSKRAEILESEGQRQSAINIAEGQKQSTILASEAIRAENINRASGEAEAILLRAKATAEGLEVVAKAIQEDGGSEAVGMGVAEKYVEAFGRLAKEGNAVVVPAGLGDMGGMIAQALSIYSKVSASQNAEKSKKQLPSAENAENIVEVMNENNAEYIPSESTITGRPRKK